MAKGLKRTRVAPLRPYRSPFEGLLPAGLPSGTRLTNWHPEAPDATVLCNRWEHILYRWPERYKPDHIDVLKVCKEIGLF